MRKARRTYQKYKKQRLKEIARERHDRDAWVTERYGRHAHFACGKKRRYETQVQANAIAACNMTTDCQNANLTAYHCPFCDGWHLTHHPHNDEFWHQYVSHAKRYLQKKLESLEANDAESLDLDYTKTKSLTRLHAWERSHQPCELSPTKSRKGTKQSMTLHRKRQCEIEWKEIILQERLP